MGKHWNWGVIFDAGSSGTRLHIYKWKDPLKDTKGSPGRYLPTIKLDKVKKTRPGASSFSDIPHRIGEDHLKSLVEAAVHRIPREEASRTPIYFLATAGMRLLPAYKQTELLQEVCDYLQQNTPFYIQDCQNHVRIIPGETEGLYGWMSANYLLGAFDQRPSSTYGFLDMGGASAQIAFTPVPAEAEKHANDLKLLRLRSLDGSASEYRIFTASWLGFGANLARDRYINRLKELYIGDEQGELPDPCLPKGLRTTLDGEPIPIGEPSGLVLTGTGMFDECLRETYPLLEKDAPCPDKPCLFNGQHIPAIDFDVNRFVGISEFWHTTHGVFSTDERQVYDIATYQQTVKTFCGQDWSAITAGIHARKKTDDERTKDSQEACFKASWLINILHKGIGIPLLGHELSPHSHNLSRGAVEGAQSNGLPNSFTPLDKVAGVDVSWTLGKMLLVASAQISASDHALPVGFGSNEPGTPPDFEFGGPILASAGRPQAGNEYSDLFNHPLSKVVVLLLPTFCVVALFVLIFRKTDFGGRLLKYMGLLYRRLPFITSRKYQGSIPFFQRTTIPYERLAEDDEFGSFSQGVRISDDAVALDTLSPHHPYSVRTPKPGTERLDGTASQVYIDRSGLVVRTESRESLAPSIQMLNAGRRSRATSPTRAKPT